MNDRERDAFFDGVTARVTAAGIKLGLDKTANTILCEEIIRLDFVRLLIAQESLFDDPHRNEMRIQIKKMCVEGVEG